MKKYLLVLMISIGILALAACTNNAETTTDDSEVVVESEAGSITKDELYEAMKERYGEQVLRELVYGKVLSEKYEVTDEEVQKEVDTLKEQYGDQFPMLLQQSGFKSEEQLKQTMKVGLLQEKLAMKDIEVTDEEIQEHYDALKPEIQASHILVADEETAKEVKQKLDEGAAFEKLVEEYSTDAGTVPAGGDLGFFGTGVMDPAFEEAAYALEVGEISGPVQSQFGFHIIKLTDKKQLDPLEDMRETIVEDLGRAKVDFTQVEAMVLQELEEANVEVKDEDLKNMFEPAKE
ncbi:foldase protein PrsA [Bacillus mesophilus]|uniref:Foldase protein PrsA n=1 Tax=Bacillus mesophilus TaxID=1808955 RepID=A0A6M0Q3P8_9BACI|nr:peptidylprolyl isomerase [Bacillus mesophilus]MBM7659932.1 foldase protein PrsA [Bacillus mesophilus]NEY70793.1 peptidylprolyl isomerase PrsA [Bacillus mesophilus]